MFYYIMKIRYINIFSYKFQINENPYVINEKVLVLISFSFWF